MTDYTGIPVDFYDVDVCIGQPPPDPNCVMRIQTTGEANVIRIDVAIRLRWVCASGHDHRWRLTAWLCSNFVKKVD